MSARNNRKHEINSRDQKIKNLQIKEYFSDLWDDASKQIIRKMISDTIDVFTKNNDTIFLFYGSLLGFARNESIIPWDGDVDFFVDFVNRPTKSFDDLKLRGYSLLGSNNTHKRIYRQDGLKTRKNWTWPWIDFYNFEIKKDNIHFLQNQEEPFYVCDVNEIFPLQKKKFETIDVYVPNVVDKHLDRIYPDWQNIYENSKVRHKILQRRKTIIRITKDELNDSQC